MIIAICGLPGSGKTYFSKKLANVLGYRRFSSDELRSEMKQLGLYDEGSRLAVYKEMVRQARPLLKKEQTIILDASFNNQAQRQLLKDLAKEHNNRLIFIQCIADEASSLARVNQTREHTEADSRVYYLLRDLWEALEPPYLRLDTVQESLETRLEKTKRYLNSFKN